MYHVTATLKMQIQIDVYCALAEGVRLSNLKGMLAPTATDPATHRQPDATVH